MPSRLALLNFFCASSCAACAASTAFCAAVSVSSVSPDGRRPPEASRPPAAATSTASARSCSRPFRQCVVGLHPDFLGALEPNVAVFCVPAPSAPSAPRRIRRAGFPSPYRSRASASKSTSPAATLRPFATRPLDGTLWSEASASFTSSVCGNVRLPLSLILPSACPAWRSPA